MKSLKQRYMEVIMMMNKVKLCKRGMNLVTNFCMASCMNYCMVARLGGHSGSAVLFPAAAAGGAGLGTLAYLGGDGMLVFLLEFFCPWSQ